MSSADARDRAGASPRRPITVTLAGVGRVGRDFTRIAAVSDEIEVVGAYSRNTSHVGRNLGDLAGRDGVFPDVVGDLDEALATPSEVLVVATASRLEDVAPFVRKGVESGRHVLTTAEEACFPWASDAALAEELNRDALARGVTVLGTGVNPGYAFDALVITACGAAWDVSRLEVERVLDISGYSRSILRMLGLGFTDEAFARGRADGTIAGHIGFPQSMHVVARALGLEIELIEREITPTFTDEPIEVNGLAIAAGETAGFDQRYVAYADGEVWFTANLIAHVALEEVGCEPRDSIDVHGSVPVRMHIEPGLNSQTTVSAVVANSLERVLDGLPGWQTVADLPPARPRGRRKPQPMSGP